ncbi:MAG TPA: YhcN/YlaJ family sporulation lipoprotein [Pseudogracilibacillus sp.]|nr:YhcN/YlaJ family sporulation lipoprotein [Pseudogracilibacillus sp.]
MRIIFAIVSLSMLLLVACTTNESQSRNSMQNGPPVEQTNQDNNMNMASNTEIANHLANVAKGVADVDQAVAIVAGPYAVVGIDIDEKAERQRVGTIKFSVSEALREDPYGKTAVIIADADASERLRKMNERIQAGEPIIGIVDELAEIVARFMPTFPVEQPSNQDTEQDDAGVEKYENGNPDGESNSHKNE